MRPGHPGNPVSERTAMSTGPPPPDGTRPPPKEPSAETPPATTACPVCGGRLIEIRAKLVCSRCRTICETCCEGGRG
jgi:hypothetical protein